MAQRTLISWRDIPAQVVVKRGRTSVKRELPPMFLQAIDQAAMIAGAKADDAYLAEWRRSEPVACGDDLDHEADAAVADILKAFDKHRLSAMAKNGGHRLEPTPVTSSSNESEAAE